MSLSPFLSIAGAATVSAVGKVASNAANQLAQTLRASRNQLDSTLSFAETLARGTLQQIESSPPVTGKLSFQSINGREDAIDVLDKENIAALKQLHDVISQSLRRLGINPSLPIELRSDGTGIVIVDGDHPQRAEIEQLFQSDQELSELFHSIVSDRALLQTQLSGKDFDPLDITIRVGSKEAVFN